MKTLICPGYEGHPCGKTVERTAPSQTFCRECRKLYNSAYSAAHKEEIKAYNAAYRAERKEELKAYRDAHKEERKALNVAYRAANKEKIRAYGVAYSVGRREQRKAYNDANREKASVRQHYRFIFGTKITLPLKNYEGMPFCDAWNPKRGGSYSAGGDWIIANLGRKPEGCSLNIVDHTKGFIPGNLEWTHPTKQSANQMFKIIARQRHEIKELQREIQKLRAEIQETKTRAA